MNTETTTLKPKLEPITSAKALHWRRCYTSDLVRHFKRFRRDDYDQFERLQKLQLDLNDVLEAFPPVDINNHRTFDFNIMLGLDPKLSVEEFSFQPVLTVTGNAMVSKEFAFRPCNDISSLAESAEVPYEYLQWVTKTWLERSSDKIAEVFEARFPKDLQPLDAPVKRAKKRLLGYYFDATNNKTLWNFINDHRGSIERFVFHLGADLNKEGYAGGFTFSPVFEVVIRRELNHEQLIDLHYNGVQTYKVTIKDNGITIMDRGAGSTDGVTGEVAYFEYTSPCPSSCPAET